MRKTQLFKDLSVVLLFFLVVFGGYFGIKKLVEIGEIQTINDQIALGSLTQEDVDFMITQKAKDYGTEALATYEAMKANYPEPVVTILSDYEAQNTEEEEVDAQSISPQYLLKTGTEDKNFTLELKVETLNEAGEDLMIGTTGHIVFWKPDDEWLTQCEGQNGTYSCDLDLKNLETSGSLLVKNIYKEVSLNFLIIRDENEEEEKDRLLSDKASEICSEYPEWTLNECKLIADKKIWIGMSVDMLIYLRGDPNNKNVSNYGDGNQYQFCWWYYDISCVYDENGDGRIDSYN